MELSLRTSWWIKFASNLALIISSLYLITLRAMGNWKYSTSTWNLHSRNCEKDPTNWDKYPNQVLASYCVTPNLTMAETTFFLVYRRDPNLPLHQLSGTNATFLRWLRIWKTQLRKSSPCTSHCQRRHWMKIVSRNHRKPPSFQIGDRVYFKNKQPGKWDLKWRPGYRIVHIEHDRHYLHIENQADRKNKIMQCKGHSTWTTWLNSGTLTLSLAELGNT